MRYMLLIYGNDNHRTSMSEAQMGEMMAAYGAFTAEIQQSGIMLAGEPLQPIATATTVRVRDGKTQTTDGPFAETKEQLGGFYIVETDDLDEAVELASKMPHLEDGGSVEVRPIWELQ